jgi:hypothetical protein
MVSQMALHAGMSVKEIYNELLWSNIQNSPSGIQETPENPE